MSDDTLQISLLQHEPVPADIPAALQRLDRYCAEASTSGSDLLVVPEASVTGYNIEKAQMQQVALEADGETTAAIADICRRHTIAVTYGFAEHDNGTYYNCVQLIDHNGEVQGKYRKTHLWGDLDRTLFSPGQTLACHPHNTLATLGGFKVGLLICYDIEFPECVRTLALQGAELILTPTGLMQPFSEVAEQVVPVRAYESQLFIAYANYCGSENDLTYEGCSCIVGPDGKDLARADKNTTLLTASISKQAIVQQRSVLPYHRDRRPALYSQPAVNS
jgi:predicted amidohydrolase